MKNAAGEANITVITIVLIGVIAAIGFIVVPRIMNNIKLKQCCSEAGGVMEDGACTYKNMDSASFYKATEIRNQCMKDKK